MPSPFKMRPDAYDPPDVAEWERTHHRQPYPLPPQPAAALRARELVQLDLSTIDAEPAFAIQDELTGLCEGLLAALDAGADAALCYFHAQDGLFWVYPYETVKGTKAPIIYIDEWKDGPSQTPL